MKGYINVNLGLEVHSKMKKKVLERWDILREREKSSHKRKKGKTTADPSYLAGAFLFQSLEVGLPAR